LPPARRGVAGATITFDSGRMHARHRQRAAWRPRPAGAGAAASLTNARTPPLTWRRRVPARPRRASSQRVVRRVAVWHWHGEATRRCARTARGTTQRTGMVMWCPLPITCRGAAGAQRVAGALRPSLIALPPALTPRGSVSAPRAVTPPMVTAHGRTCQQSV